MHQKLGYRFVQQGISISIEKIKEENKALYDTVVVKNDGGCMY